jgi:hypothetical protein
MNITHVVQHGLGAPLLSLNPGMREASRRQAGVKDGRQESGFPKPILAFAFGLALWPRSMPSTAIVAPEVRARTTSILFDPVAARWRGGAGFLFGVLALGVYPFQKFSCYTTDFSP